MKANNGLEGILKKCSRLMAKKGYAGTSMRDLAQATDRSLAGLYHYFQNKEDLLYLINHRGFSLLLKSAERTLAKDLSPEERLYAIIYNHVHYFNLHKDEMRVMVLGTQGLDAKRAKTISSLKKEYGRKVETIVAEVHKHLNGTKMTASELSRKTFLLFGMMNWVFGWYSPKKHGTEETLVNDIYLGFMGVIQSGNKRNYRAL